MFFLPWPWAVLQLFFIVSHTWCAPMMAFATKMHYIHWNSTNPIFRIDNTNHIIDVNKGNVPFEYDQVNIICPVYSNVTGQDDAEKYIIYNVSKEEYETCHITNRAPRIIAVCDKPHKLMYFTITFRSFTPTPGGLEFKPGQDYYFISTSSRSDMFSRTGGRCASHNMKVVFKVCCDPAAQTPRDQAREQPEEHRLQSKGVQRFYESSTRIKSTTRPYILSTKSRIRLTTQSTPYFYDNNDRIIKNENDRAFWRKTPRKNLTTSNPKISTDVENKKSLSNSKAEKEELKKIHSGAAPVYRFRVNSISAFHGIIFSLLFLQLV